MTTASALARSADHARAESVKRIVVYRHGSLGDAVVALPCFHLIERTFPDAERLLLTNVPVSHKAGPLESVLRNGGFVHGSISYPIGIRDLRSLLTLARQLRALDCQTLVYLAGIRGLRAAWRDVAYFRLCGFSAILGAPLTWDLQRRKTDPDGLLERESVRLTRCLAQLGPIDLSDRSWWNLRLTNAERSQAATALAPLGGRQFLAINMGGKAAEKDWGPTNWSALLRGLSSQLPGLSLVLLGGPEDSGRSAQSAESWPSGDVLNLCGRLTPRESAAVLERAGLFIGHDSGPLHLADAVGTPSVGLYGDFNVPKTWYPSGVTTAIVHDARGMAAISPETVKESALRVRAQIETVGSASLL